MKMSHQDSTRGCESTGLQFRCPSCKLANPIAESSDLGKVACSGCGEVVNLIGHDETRSLDGSVGRSIGHFEMTERLGMGAFGAVYKSRDHMLDRWVAIKLPRRGQLSSSESEKFLREARTAAQLSHPNIVSVFEVGRDGEQVYIVSDYIEGVTLADWLTAKPFQQRDAAKLCVKLCRALDYAHRCGVVHRDLKPANIMMNAEGEPHIMDFGLAKRDSGELTMTLEGQVLGSPAYMPPEQASGNSHTVDNRGDIYALGVILFQLLTLELPFRGNSAMLLHQALHDEPPSPRKFNATLSRDLETICLKCLEKNPSRRFATANDLADELQRFLDGRPIQSRRITQVERAYRWGTRNRVLAGMLLAFVASLLFGSIGSATFGWLALRESWRADERAAYATKQEQIAAEHAKEASLRSDQAQRVAFYSQAESSLARGRYAQAFELNQRLARQNPRWDYGYQTSRLIDALDTKRKLIANFPCPQKPIWATLNDGILLYQEPSPSLRVSAYDVWTDQILASVDAAVQWSQVTPVSGDQWIGIAEDQVLTGDLETLQIQDSLPLKHSSLAPPADSVSLEKEISIVGALHANRAAVLYPDGLVELYDTKPLQKRSEFQLKNLKPSQHSSWFQLSNDGKRLVYKVGQQGTYLYDVEQNKGVISKHDTTHTIQFGTDPDNLFGMMYKSNLTDFMYFQRRRWQDSRSGPPSLTSIGKNKFVRGIGVTGELLDMHAGGASSMEESIVTLRYEDNLSTFRVSAPDAGETLAFADMCPQAGASATVVAHDLADGLVVFHTGGSLQAYLVRLLAKPADANPVPPVLQASPRGFCGTENRLFIANTRSEPVWFDLATETTSPCPLERPPTSPGRMMSVYDAKLSSDTETLLVLWNENDYFGYGAANFFGLQLAAYDLSGGLNEQGQIPIKTLITCPTVGDSAGQGWRGTGISSDGTTGIYIYGEAGPESIQVEIYDLSTGKRTAALEPQQFVRVDDSGDWLLTYSMDKVAPVRLYAIHQEAPVLEVMVDAPVSRAALDLARNQIHVGLESERLCSFDVDSGKLVSSLATPLAVVKTIDGSPLFFGVQQTQSNYGSLVLSSFEHGRVIEVLDRTFWFSSNVTLSENSRVASYAERNSEVRIFRSLSPEQAIASLERVKRIPAAWELANRSSAPTAFDDTRFWHKLQRAIRNQDQNETARLSNRIRLFKNNRDVNRRLRDIYAGYGQWKKALEASRQAGFGNHDPRHLMLLGLAGAPGAYEQARSEFLDQLSFPLAGHQNHVAAIAVGLTQIPTKHHATIEAMTENAMAAEHNWESAMALKLRYPMGDYLTKRDELKKAKGMPEEAIVVAMARYLASPTEATRKRLVESYDKLLEKVEAVGERDVPMKYWHELVEDQSQLNYARELLSK
ncbi:Serine/threonine-protein kinase PrkC [Roseimaritima ulvae]|uniref:non-specific serine/threonine protein kinase n=2 Tax=Roseimaritima ulvae TaxID=980254 RepID=A0A5B9QYR8_9BACT|nr:Serine/threonine-protein kinase PrkC [Roseimaritima ulvae]